MAPLTKAPTLIQTGEAQRPRRTARPSTPSTTRVPPGTMEQQRPPAETSTPPRTAMRTRTPAAAGNLRVRTPMAHTAGTTLPPPTITTHPVEPARDQRHSADSLAEAGTVGNHDPQARAAGAVAEAAEAGEVAAPV